MGAEPADAEQFRAVPGKGIYAEIEKKDLIMGTPKFLAENGIDVQEADEVLKIIHAQGKTAVLMAIDGDLLTLIVLSDTIKENSGKVVARLKKMGIEVFMLTGDNKNAARSVANKVGIKNVLAEVLPGEKAQEIIKLKNQGRIVAMVGDGINDAPALAAADLGFAMGTGTDIAMETGDIILLKEDLSPVPAAINLSRKTMRKIKENLFWAFIYNIVGIPIAATGHLDPVIAAAAMGLSSMSVLMNSLSLKRFQG